jgi:TetR/AcrR family transcriptional regulator
MPRYHAAPARRKRTTQRADQIRALILDEAINAFARYGYEGARMRSIARDAGVSVQLLVHHVKSKDALWRMTMESIIDKYNAAMASSETQTNKASITAAARLRQAITELAAFMSSTPQLLRIMTLEAAHPTPRMLWLAERFTKMGFESWCTMIEAAQREGAVRHASPARLRFAIVAMVSLPFAVAAEYEYFTGRSPFAKNEVTQTIELVCDMVFIRKPS